MMRMCLSDRRGTIESIPKDSDIALAEVNRVIVPAPVYIIQIILCGGILKE
jgi:hypothetical protein